jgi:signal transduction histidine kinase
MAQPEETNLDSATPAPPACREVRRAEKERQALRDFELINHMAHEINNPLQPVMNCMTMFEYSTDKKYVEIAHEHLIRAAQAVTDLVKVTSAEKSGKE